MRFPCLWVNTDVASNDRCFQIVADRCIPIFISWKYLKKSRTLTRARCRLFYIYTCVFEIDWRNAHKLVKRILLLITRKLKCPNPNFFFAKIIKLILRNNLRHFLFFLLVSVTNFTGVWSYNYIWSPDHTRLCKRWFVGVDRILSHPFRTLYSKTTVSDMFWDPYQQFMIYNTSSACFQHH